MKLGFLGAARQVTGSSYFVEADGLRCLVDCGLHQERSFLDRNWDPFPVPPEDLDFVLLTHAHLDHSGLLPRLVHDGFSGTVLTTAATADLVSIALMDAAAIQEEDAAFKRRRHAREGRTVDHPVVPLYTTEDVQATMPLVEEVAYDSPFRLSSALSVRFRDAGHILGSAMIELTVRGDGETRTIVFSGDIGQWDMPFVRDPSLFDAADYIVMESTYGDREHEDPGRIGDLLAGIDPRDGRGRRERRHPDLRHRAGPGPDVPPQPPRLRQGHPGPARVPRQPDGQGSDAGLRAPRRVLRRGGPAALRRGPEPVPLPGPDHRPHARGIQGHQRIPRAGGHHGRLGHGHRRPDQAPPRPEHRPARIDHPLRRLPGPRDPGPPDPRGGRGRSASSGRPCRSGPA